MAMVPPQHAMANPQRRALRRDAPSSPWSLKRCRSGGGASLPGTIVGIPQPIQPHPPIPRAVDEVVPRRELVQEGAGLGLVPALVPQSPEEDVVHSSPRPLWIAEEVGSRGIHLHRSLFDGEVAIGVQGRPEVEGKEIRAGLVK